MRKASFVDIVEKHFYWSLDTRLADTQQKLISICAQRNVLDGVEAMSMALTTVYPQSKVVLMRL
jgi:phenylalanine-4-hydroxylase